MDRKQLLKTKEEEEDNKEVRLPQLTILKNACFVFQSKNTRVIVDPYLTRKEAQSLGTFNAVLVSHGHLDHVWGLKSLRGPRIGNRYVATRKGDFRIEPGETVRVGSIEITAVPAWGHPSRLQRMPGYDVLGWLLSGVRHCGEAMGFVFRTGNCTIYYTGDTPDVNCWLENCRNYNPDVVLANVQPCFFPRLLPHPRQIKSLSPRVVIPLHC